MVVFGAYVFYIVIFFVVAAPIWVVISLIFRPYVLWYLKINKRMKLQEETNRLLKEISSKRPIAAVKRESDYSAYMPKNLM